MAENQGKRPSSSENERINFDPRTQTAVERSIRKTHARKRRNRIIWGLFLLAFLAIVPHMLPEFYCRHIIGTNYETVITMKYPLFTPKVVRFAIALDKWYMKAEGPLLRILNSDDEITFRKSVVDLGLEATKSEGEQDQQKIQELREKVGPELAKLSDPRGAGVAFAVYELPPKR